MLKYAEKVYGLCSQLRLVQDGRVNARILTQSVLLSFLMLQLARLGSLNAFEQMKAPPAWKKWLGNAQPSADVMGKVLDSLRPVDLRAILDAQHAKTKRNKALKTDESSGFRYLVLDGHEGVASYRRTWKECLERVIHFKKGDRTQYYHRFVAAFLSNGKQNFLLDAENQLPGEGEIACATRLVTRLLKQHPRAFNVVCGDNLYMDPTLWKLIRSKKKHVIAVLKNENRDLLVDARSLFDDNLSFPLDEENVKRKCWDMEGFNTWPQCGESVRVVRSLECTTVRRQLNKKEQKLKSEWFWVTSIPSYLAPTQTIVRAGHGRWDIENYAFNELSTKWHGDHVYRYTANAMLTTMLLIFIAYNLFHAFINGNIKPEARAGRSEMYWAKLIAAELAIAFHSYTAPT